MIYNLIITDQARSDIKKFKKAGNKSILIRIEILLNELAEHPFVGTGKPEPLKYQMAGLWSRRINREHRLIYEVVEPNVIVVSSFGHYN